MAPKREGDKGAEQDQRSRREQIEAEQGAQAAALRPPPLSPEDLCTQYLEMLFEAGPTEIAGMGAQIALSWPALRAWRMETGVTLTPPEARLLRILSGVYASALSSMAKADALPSWLEQSEDFSQAQEDQFVRFFEQLAGPTPKTSTPGA